MRNGFLSFVFSVMALNAFAQVRADKLVIGKGEIFKLDQDADIIVADSIIMLDSSRIELNSLKPENFIRAKVIIVEHFATIVGSGIHGKPGRPGKAGNSLVGPCRDGTDGSQGTPGLAGGTGTNFFLYVNEFIIKGKLVIDLTGGNGGDGGIGGNGGDGSPGTIHCLGGNGGNGSDGGRGGDGGNAGNLIINSPHADLIRNWIGNKIQIVNYGGKAGFGGRGGYVGSAGLGPSKKNGKDGSPGSFGTNGVRGKDGTITFDVNQ